MAASSSSSSAAAVDHLSSFPDPFPAELYMEIFSHLDESTLRTCGLVCKFWNGLVNDNQLWRNLCREKEPNATLRNYRSWKLYYRGNYFPSIIYDLHVSQKAIFTVCGNRFSIREKRGNLSPRENITDFIEHKGGITSACLHGENNHILPPIMLTGSYDTLIKVWQRSEAPYSWNCTSILEGHSDAVTALKMIRNDLYSGSADSTIKIWQSPFDHAPKVTTLHKHTGTVTCIERGNFDTRSFTFFSGSSDMTINTWKVNIHREVELAQTLTGHTGGITALLWSSRDQQLFSGSTDHTIRVWCGIAKSMDCRQVIAAHSAKVTCLMKYPYRQLLFSGSEDKTIKVWERQAETGTWHLRATLEGHRTGVRAIRFHSVREQGEFFSISRDSDIRSWRY